VLPVVPSKVLDVGTGTGFLAWIAAELGHRVTGIDLAESMLEGALAQTAKRRLEVTFEVGDAVAPPFPDRSFDVVISRSLIWTLREPDSAFGNWYALLRPGGRVVAIYGLSAAEQPDGPARRLTTPRRSLAGTTRAKHGLPCQRCGCLTTSRYGARPSRQDWLA